MFGLVRWRPGDGAAWRILTVHLSPSGKTRDALRLLRCNSKGPKKHALRQQGAGGGPQCAQSAALMSCQLSRSGAASTPPSISRARYGDPSKCAE